MHACARHRRARKLAGGKDKKDMGKLQTFNLMEMTALDVKASVKKDDIVLIPREAMNGMVGTCRWDATLSRPPKSTT